MSSSPALRNFFRQQQLYVFIAVAVAGFFWASDLKVNFPTILIYSLCIGNLGTLILEKMSPLYCNRPFPWNWLVYLLLLAICTFPIYAIAAAAVYYLARLPDDSYLTLWQSVRHGWRFPFFVCMLWGIISYLYRSMREHLEARNRVLEEEVKLTSAEVEDQEQELQRALEIQQSFLPKDIPQVPGFEVTGAWQPSRVVGGDYFDVLKLPDGRLGVCIADVSGKGVSAALLMANLQATVRAFAPDSPSPARLCARVNSILCNNIAKGKFVTFFYGVLDSASLTLDFCNAGHLDPMVVSNSGLVRRPAGSGGTVLGLFPDAKFEDSRIAMEPGDRLLLFTDGITEAFAPDGEEFGEQRVAASARSRPDESAPEMTSRILSEVRAFCREQFNDDATLLTVAVTKPVTIASCHGVKGTASNAA